MQDFDILIPIVGILTGGGLIALFLLKPFASRILDLLEESNRSRREALRDDRELDRLRERVDLLSERQEFLEALLEDRGERHLAGASRERAEPEDAGGAAADAATESAVGSDA